MVCQMVTLAVENTEVGEQAPESRWGEEKKRYLLT